MAKEVISDFLVRLGFDGKAVIKGVAQTEAALKRLKKIKATDTRGGVLAERIQKTRIQRNNTEIQQTKAQIALEAQKTRALRRATLSQYHPFGASPKDSDPFRKQIKTARTKQELDTIVYNLGEASKRWRIINTQKAKANKLANALQFSMNGLLLSAKNLARSWVSVFAVIAGAVAGLRITQEFQAMEASMLAVSENTEKAAENVKFIKDLAQTLPVEIQKSSDQFKNMLASGAESIGQEGVQKLFKAVSEYGTALQVNPERMDRGLTAISQMLNKSQIMALDILRSFKISLIAGNSTIFA